MSLLGKLFSSDKIIDAGIKAGDALMFTDEERTNLMMEYAKATLPMNVSRRVIAIVVTAVWAVSVLLCGVLILLSHPKTDAMMQFVADAVMVPFSIIMAFYFLAQVVTRRRG